MSIHQVAAEAQAVVDRARSPFGSAEPLTPAGVPLASAAESTARVGRRTGGLAGDLVERHTDFVGEQTYDLSHAGRTDITLEPARDYRVADQPSRSVAATKATSEATQAP